MPRRGERTVRSLAVSVVLHALLIASLFSIVFRYSLGQLMGIPRERVQPETITYVKVAPQTTQTTRPAATPEQGARPAALTAPTAVPTEVPPPDSGTSRTAGGDGRGKGVVGAGLATGVMPLPPDPRIDLTTEPLQRVPANHVQIADSLIALMVGVVNDSIEARREAAKLPEWIKKTRVGEFGLTSQYIALGPVKIPTALLALTPLNQPGRTSPIELRREAWIRRDVLENAQRSISEDEFRAAVKRIRERKEREAREKSVAESRTKAKAAPAPTLVP